MAILPVILFHAGLGCSGGFVGVDIFFVISGFLITSLILKEINDDAFSLVTFWERRVRRILPALMVVVLATITAAWFLYLPDDLMSVGRSVVAQAMLMSNVFFFRHTGYFAPGTDTLPLLHTWSLAVEEQFYVLFPLLLMFLARRQKSAIPRTIVGLAIGSFALSVVGTYYAPSATFYLLPSRAWELMIGALLAALPDRRPGRQWLCETAAVCGFGLILYSIFFYTNKTRFPGLAAVPPCLGAALIILSNGGKPTLVGRLLLLRPVVFIGLISYSLYLWHWPLLVFTKYVSLESQSWELRVALLLASVALAALSWKFVEAPFRKRLVCPRRPQIFALAGGSLAALLLLGGGVYLSHGMSSQLSGKALYYASFHNDYDGHWGDVSLPQAMAGQFPEIGGQSTNQPIEMLLWGDSHAGAVTPVIDDLCRHFSVRAVEATHSGTAPLLGYVSDNQWSLKEQSPAFSKCVVDFIARKHIKTVIIAAAWTGYGTVDSLNTSLSATVQAVLASGAQVYVLKDAPKPLFDVPRFAALKALHNRDPAQLDLPPAKYQADEKLEPVFDHLSKMGVTVLNTPQYFLNTNGSYDVIRNDKILFSDDYHISIEGSKLLKPMFEPLFLQIKSTQTRIN